jgi:hypothetical protein
MLLNLAARSIWVRKAGFWQRLKVMESMNILASGNKVKMAVCEAGIALQAAFSDSIKSQERESHCSHVGAVLRVQYFNCLC